MRSHLTIFFALSTAIVLACGGSPPPETPVGPVMSDAGAATTAPTSTASAPADAGAAPMTDTKPAMAANETPKFDSLPKEKKLEVMSTKVVPEIGKMFKEHDGKHFEKFGCVTCHGPTKKEAPQKVLPKLTLSNGGFEKLAKQKPEVMKFMAEKVEPAMAAILGEKPYDPATHKGFGCNGCHTVN